MLIAPEPIVAVVIPARYGSNRFPGKPLCQFQGSDGVSRTLIEHSWRAAIEVPGIRMVAVATDDDRIAREVQQFGGVAIITPAGCRNGTERCAAVLPQLDPAIEFIVNLQGDAPLTPAAIVTALIGRLVDDPCLPMATPAIRCSPLTYRHLARDADEGRVGGTTVVFNRAFDALYFSKRIIPFANQHSGAEVTPAAFLHLGIYAYRRDALAAYMEAGIGDLEKEEGLEQLRFLEAGMRVGIAVCDAPDWEVVEVNNPGDVAVVEAIMRGRREH